VSPSVRLNGIVTLGRRVSVGWRCLLDAAPGGAIRIASGTWLSDQVEMQTSAAISIGAHTTIQRRCTVNGDVRIGSQCILAPSVFISSGDHPFRHVPWLPIRDQERLLRQDDQPLPDRPVRIDDDCWIGTNAVICPGVRVGKGAVIGANAVVTRDVSPYAVVAGAPARRIGDRLTWAPPAELDLADPQHLPYITSPLPWDSRGLLRPGEVRRDWPIEAWITARAGSAIELQGTSDSEAVLALDSDDHRVSSGPFRLQCPVNGATIDNSPLSLHMRLGGAVCITRISVIKP
jgi:acetyltransferase-like isoleucine patch superfamily enzyme